MSTPKFKIMSPEHVLKMVDAVIGFLMKPVDYSINIKYKMARLWSNY